jgi:tetratricopeptide (TPR) repeat protein
VNSGGGSVDRWMGYSTPAEFIETLHSGISDPTTIEEKKARHASSPTLAGAVKLAVISESTGEYTDAVRYYENAGELNPDTTATYAFEIFQCTAGGLREKLFTVDDVKKAAEVVLADGGPPNRLVELAMWMQSVAGQERQPEIMIPYVTAAIEASSGSEDPGLTNMRNQLVVVHALHAGHDAEKAKAHMPEGWMDDPSALNQFAWTCFEARFNLEEAERLARLGAEIAADSSLKAGILDTVAELCNLREDCGEAVALIQQAVALDPDNEYYRKQLGRFEERLASLQSSGGS